jgi:uncharacterized membrane protein
MHLKDVGIDDSRIREMAKHIANEDGGIGLSNAYVPLNEDDLVKILKESL